MAGIGNEFQADIVQTYYIAVPLDQLTEATMKAATTAANEIKSMASLGSVSATRAAIPLLRAGDDFQGTLPGQADPGTYDFTINWIPTDPIHQALTTDKARVRHTIILKAEVGDDVTYIGFHGRIGSAENNGDLGSARQWTISFLRDGPHVIVNKA